jgi:hypothetical protein
MIVPRLRPCRSQSETILRDFVCLVALPRHDSSFDSTSQNIRSVLILPSHKLAAFTAKRLKARIVPIRQMLSHHPPNDTNRPFPPARFVLFTGRYIPNHISVVDLDCVQV